MLKGRVQDRDGAPIGGVRVTVLDHPELGETNTRADGAFDIAVNGGGITLAVRRRRLPAGAAHARAGLAGLRDARRRRDGPGRPERQDDRPGLDRAVPGRARHRVRGQGRRAPGHAARSRRASTARWSSRAAARRPLDELKVRVTEFTYGEQGDEAMPGSLPANSGYTYAAEFSVDEALKAGATQVNFDKPLINYTENFIGAPVGSAVPTGYYDRETRRVEGRRRTAASSRSSPRRAASPPSTPTATASRRHRPRHDRRRAQAARDALRARPGAVARPDHPLHAVGPQLALRPAARRASRRS